jgi:hypothetical protein
MDLLTVFTHELGHQLGLDDDDGHGLTGEFLPSCQLFVGSLKMTEDSVTFSVRSQDSA